MANRLAGALVFAMIAAAARADTAAIKIEKLGYGPQQIAAHVGDTGLIAPRVVYVGMPK